MPEIDLNCDVGELPGAAGLALDAEILPLISSASCACGAHAGDQPRMVEIARLCRSYGVAFGAHPGFADRAGFGRTMMPLTAPQIYDLVFAQIQLAAKVAADEDIVLAHVKPHGALYNAAAADPVMAAAIASAVYDTDPAISLMGLSGSCLIHAGIAAGLQTISEVFADRSYQPDGSLTARHIPGAVISDHRQVAERAVSMIRSQGVSSLDGAWVPLTAQTMCVHSDTSDAVTILKELREHLQLHDIEVRCVRRASE